MSDTLACACCLTDFPATDEFFYRNGSGYLCSTCKTCACERMKLYDSTRREEKAAYDRAYRETHKEELAAKDRIKHQAHREARLTAHYLWIKTHPEEQRVYGRNRAARKKGNGGTHTAGDIREQYARQKGKCFYCGQFVGRKYHVDHVMPLALGGSNGPENLVIACADCNRKKHAQHPMDFCGMLL